MVRRATDKSVRRKDRRNGHAGALGRGLGAGILGRMFGGRGEAERARRSRTEATSIAIASGKGGTGKSFLATSLGIVLHQRGHRVTLTDCDFGLACDHLLLGVKPEKTLQHVLSGEASLEDIRVATGSGPSLVPGASGVMQMADLSDRQLMIFGSVLTEIAASDDVLLLDVGAGIAPQSILTLLCADHVILVTQPEIAALTDAYAVIKCSAQLRPEARFSVVVNRVMAPGQGQQTFDKLAQVAERHTGVELTYLGEIGEDPLVTRRRLRQDPLVVSDPEGETARAIHGVAASLERTLGNLGRKTVDADRGIEARFREHRLFL